ncbi:MAG: hypothetical protein BWY09_02972 [Candidatus Hydrogenedentes bacterium ADurb.Bin179]|nr:MAG: hypothetical protein BWY09_02972 [Candidatus Hydrogenedentes bacterium ADurb.Bin179]
MKDEGSDTETRHPKPETRHPKPDTRNPIPDTLLKGTP